MEPDRQNTGWQPSFSPQDPAEPDNSPAKHQPDHDPAIPMPVAHSEERAVTRPGNRSIDDPEITQRTDQELDRATAEGRAGSTPQPNQLAGNHPLEISQIVEQYQGALYGFAYRLTGNRADAEDMVQQTFLSAVQHLGQLRDPSKVKSWLMVTLKNGFLKVVRRRRPASVSSLQINISQMAAYEIGERPIDSEQLQAALNQLTDEHRLILTMFYFQQLSYREIAAQLDLKIGTVMSRLSRAKSRLRGILLHSEGDQNE